MQQTQQPARQSVQLQTAPVKQPVQKKTSRLAIIALVFSTLFFIPLFSLVGIILGIIALTKIKKNPSLGGQGLAIAAIVLGAFFSLFLWVGLIIGFVKGIAAKGAIATS